MVKMECYEYTLGDKISQTAGKGEELRIQKTQTLTTKSDRVHILGTQLLCSFKFQTSSA